MSAIQSTVLPSQSSRLFSMLIEPLDSKIPGTERRNAILLTYITLVFTVGIAIRLIFFSFQPTILLGTVMSATAYYLSRTRYYRLAGLLVVIAGMSPSLASVLSGTPGDNIQDWIVARCLWMGLPLLLASAFLRVREMAGISIVTFTLIALIPLLNPAFTYSDIVGLLGFYGIFNLLILVAMRHRNQIEQDRQQELTQTNIRLRESEALLEKRVEERTLELKIAKDEAEAARQRAEQSDQVKSQFLASMSHELRTPLNAILNFVDMTLMGIFGPINDEQADAMQKSLDSGKHLLSLINDVLDITKIHSGMMKLFMEDDVDLGEECRTAAAATESLILNKKLQFNIEIDSLPIIRADRRRIRQVLLNLLSNATRFTERGSITLRARADNGKVIFTVADTGPGIAPEDQAIVFEPFQQTDTGIRHAGGTGLGLPISKYLMEAHGGRLWVESTVGQGATFFAELPITSSAA